MITRFQYNYRMKPRACTEEDQRLHRMLWSQRRRRIATGAIATLLGLMLALGAYLLWGRAVLEALTRP